MTFSDWCETLRANRYGITPRYWHRAALITVGSALNSWYRGREDRAFGERLDRVSVPPPLFILGHWRSGTTLLHNLLALDDRFAYPNLYEVFFPHTFLSTEDDRTGLVAPLIPRTRVFDNVAQGLDMPNEDEFATAVASLCSPYMLWAFPREARRFERFLTFRDATEAELTRWKEAFLLFLKKLTIRYGRPLLLKSPPHTGRVRLLLEMFPDAKFIHVHREPYTVFRSTRHLNDVLTRSLRFQVHDASEPERDETVIRRYRQIHDAYFDERGLIRAGTSTNSRSTTSSATRSVRSASRMRRWGSAVSTTCAIDSTITSRGCRITARTHTPTSRPPSRTASVRSGVGLSRNGTTRRAD